MFRLILSLTLTLSATAFVCGQGKTILGVFAHPDDENMIGSVLARYSRLGNKVFVIIGTDGQYGTRVTKIPEGAELARVRRAESECAARKLNIEKPIFFSIDRLDTKFGVRPYLTSRKSFIEKLKGQIQALDPDVLITFGPDGEYGHSEHIVVGAAVTELLLREGWAEKYPVYFPVDTKETAADDPDLGYVSEKYINVSVTFTDQDDERHNEAVRCYVSQFTEEEMKETIEQARADTKNTRHFRRWAISGGRPRKELLP